MPSTAHRTPGLTHATRQRTEANTYTTAPRQATGGTFIDIGSSVSRTYNLYTFSFLDHVRLYISLGFGYQHGYTRVSVTLHTYGFTYYYILPRMSNVVPN